LYLFTSIVVGIIRFPGRLVMRHRLKKLPTAQRELVTQLDEATRAAFWRGYMLEDPLAEMVMTEPHFERRRRLTEECEKAGVSRKFIDYFGQHLPPVKEV